MIYALTFHAPVQDSIDYACIFLKKRYQHDQEVRVTLAEHLSATQGLGD